MRLTKTFGLSCLLTLTAAACAPGGGGPSTDEPSAGGESPKEDAEVGGALSVLIDPTLYDVTGGDGGLISQWADENGVEVEVSTAPGANLRERALIEGAAGSGRYDAYVIQDFWLNEEITPFLEPLNGYLDSADQDYERDDFVPNVLEAYQLPRGSGEQYAIPWRLGTVMLYYRADLFEKAGLEVPTSWDDFYAAAEKLTSDGVYGVTEDLYPGGKSMLRIMYAHGAQLLSEDQTTCTINGPKGVAALQMVADLFKNQLIDPEAMVWERDAALAAMQQGRAAMTVNYSPYWGRITDPEAGDFADQMRWALVPVAGETEPGHSINDGWGWVIDRNSDNKASAWSLIEHLTAADTQLRLAVDNGNGPVRESVYNAQEYQQAFPLAEDWLAAAAASDFLPPHPRYQEIQDIVNEEASMAYLGDKSAKEALDGACDRIDELLG